MDILEFAAFGGLILGIVNLFLILYKDFFRKSKLEVSNIDMIIKSKELPYPENYYFQIDLRLCSKRGFSSIKEVQILNDREFTSREHKNHKNLILKRYLPYRIIELEDVRYDGLDTRVKGQFANNSSLISDVKIEENAFKSFTFIDKIDGIRESDGWDKLPEKGWKLKLLYDEKEILLDLIPKFVKK